MASRRMIPTRIPIRHYQITETILNYREIHIVRANNILLRESTNGAIMPRTSGLSGPSHRGLLILSDLDNQNEANLGSHPSPAWVPSNMATGPSPSYSEISGRNLSIVPTFSFTFVEKYIHKRNISSGSSHINKGVKYFSEGYIHQIRGK